MDKRNENNKLQRSAPVGAGSPELPKSPGLTGHPGERAGAGSPTSFRRAYEPPRLRKLDHAPGDEGGASGAVPPSA